MAFLSKLPSFGLRNAVALFKKGGSVLGVDIGSSSIKVVQLKKEKERAVLETYGELSLGGYAKGETGQASQLVDIKLSEALEDVLRESQVKTKEAVIGVPLRDSFLTVIRMPQLSETELKEAIPYEARRYIPIPINETMVDWFVLPKSSTESSNSSIGSKKKDFVSVLLVAVPFDIIEKYKRIIKNVGINPIAFEIEAFATARSSMGSDSRPSLLMDIGAGSTNFIIVDMGVVRAAHGIGRGSQDLTLTLTRSLGIEFERAEILKRENGIIRRPESDGIVSAIEPSLGTLLAEGERFLLDWKRKGGKSMSRVILSGGGSALKGLEDAVVKKFGVEAEHANPFSRVMYPAFLEPTLKDIGPSFSNAVGLALRDL